MKTKLFALFLSSAFAAAYAEEPSAKEAAPSALKETVAKDAGDTNVIRLADGTVIPPLKSNTNKVVLTNLTMQASYAMGLQTAGTIFMQDYQNDVDVELFIAGLRDVFGHYKPMLPPEDIEEILKSFDKFMQIKDQQKNLKIAEENKVRGEKFLEENKKKEGVVTTASGLQYKVVKEGSGEPPTYDDKVGIHFVGKTIDGREFSTTYKHKEPAIVPLRAQIMGMREALQMMKPGSKWEIYVPAKLAYREREVGRGVGPNSTLIFELELVRIEKDSGESDKKQANAKAPAAVKN